MHSRPMGYPVDMKGLEFISASICKGLGVANWEDEAPSLSA